MVKGFYFLDNFVLGKKDLTNPVNSAAKYQFCCWPRDTDDIQLAHFLGPKDKKKVLILICLSFLYSGFIFQSSSSVYLYSLC